ncbi:anaerobic ribonucleoside-triphosphate reductase activating protein [Sulfurimonas sp.]
MSIESEFSLKNNKIIYDVTKFTHLDYPEHLAAIIWFSGCNMRCDYCYNSDIVFAKSGQLSMQDILDFLQTRISLLDGVVLSGGEATAYDLLDFCKEIKNLGFAIKLDTNGTYVKELKKLLDAKVLDYIALDYKAPKEKFMQITHSRNYASFSKSLDMLLRCDIDFEVRTTLHKDLLHEEDINTIITDLHSRGYDKEYYIQGFLETPHNIGNLTQTSSDFDKDKLLDKLKVVWR